jgi:hypothetical protein
MNDAPRPTMITRNVEAEATNTSVHLQQMHAHVIARFFLHFLGKRTPAKLQSMRSDDCQLITLPRDIAFSYQRRHRCPYKHLRHVL